MSIQSVAASTEETAAAAQELVRSQRVVAESSASLQRGLDANASRMQELATSIDSIRKDEGLLAESAEATASTLQEMARSVKRGSAGAEDLAAATYVYEVSNGDPNFGWNNLFREDNLTTTTHSFDSSFEATFYVRVYAVSADGIRGVPSNVISYNYAFNNPIGPAPVALAPIGGQTGVADLHEIGNRNCLRPDRNRLLAIPQPGEPNGQRGWGGTTAIASARCHNLAIQLGTGFKIGVLTHWNPLRRLYHDRCSNLYLAGTKRSSQIYRQSDTLR